MNPTARSPAGAPDAVLARRLRCGDEAALSTLYDRYAAMTLAVAFRVTGSRQCAEEVVQEVFLWVWQHPERFDATRGTMRAWLAVLAHRRAVDRTRADAAARRRRIGERCAAAPSAEDVVIAGEDAAHADQLVAALRTAMAGLPPAQHDVVRMLYFEGLRVREIATRLGVPEGTAKTRLRAARQHLAARLRAHRMRVPA